MNVFLISVSILQVESILVRLGSCDFVDPSFVFMDCSL